MCEGMETQFSVLLTSAVDGNEWSALRLSERAYGTHCIGGFVAPTAGPDPVKIISPPEVEPRFLGRPAMTW